jgi:sugar/nucleoside kinase (ribokinase family)
MGAPIVVIKKGEHGVLVHCGAFVFSVPAYPVERIVDPTGAGDTFAGGFMGYLAKAGRVTRENLKQAVLCGTIMASFNVEGFGVERISGVTRRDLRRRIARFKTMASF